MANQTETKRNTKNKCQHCGKYYNPENHSWSAGFGCAFYCSKACCDNAAEIAGHDESNWPYCPCF